MIDLQKFCSTEPTRYYLHSPWSRGEFTYATNGTILARVPRRDDVAEQPRAPDCETKILMVLDFAQEFAPVPEFSLPTEGSISCEDCYGRGTDHDCPGCQCVCDWCNGLGATSDDPGKTISLDGAMFALKYARIIFPLPGILMPAKCVPALPCPIKFDGGIGCWMPMINTASKGNENNTVLR